MPADDIVSDSAESPVLTVTTAKGHKLSLDDFEYGFSDPMTLYKIVDEICLHFMC